MSKLGIEAQVEKWLVGRGRWLRSGGDNLVRYLSVMLGNGDQVDDLVELLTAEERPEWLYVERDGRRVTLIGLTHWQADQAVEYEEVAKDAWEIVAAQYAEITRLQQQLNGVTARRDELEELCSELTDPHAPVVSVVVADEVKRPACDHGALEQELSSVRTRAAALDSVNTNNQQVIAGLRATLRSGSKELKAVRRSANTATSEREEMARALLELVCLVMNAPGANSEAYDLARRQLMKFANLFKRVLDRPATREVRQVLQELSA